MSTIEELKTELKAACKEWEEVRVRVSRAEKSLVAAIMKRDGIVPNETVIRVRGGRRAGTEFLVESGELGFADDVYLSGRARTKSGFSKSVHRLYGEYEIVGQEECPD